MLLFSNFWISIYNNSSEIILSISKKVFFLKALFFFILFFFILFLSFCTFYFIKFDSKLYFFFLFPLLSLFILLSDSFKYYPKIFYGEKIILKKHEKSIYIINNKKQFIPFEKILKISLIKQKNLEKFDYYTLVIYIKNEQKKYVFRNININNNIDIFLKELNDLFCEKFYSNSGDGRPDSRF